MKINKIVASLFAAGVMSSPLAHATNGMNLEGYGPVAAAMGGASMAYDNGTAAVMNNPATLGLMADGSRIDVALGILAPSITANCVAGPCTGMEAKSLSDAFFMPAVGYANKSGQLTYGVGVFSQGGMGTEYEGNTFMSAGSGKKTRSEVGVGRFIIPLAYNVDDQITVAGSLDFVWASMDLQMAMDMITQMGPMMQPGGSAAGVITMDANTSAGLPTMMAGFTGTGQGYFNFSDSGKFSGAAKGNGYAGKIGVTYKVSQELTVGGTYHSKTAMGDLNASGVSMSLIDGGPSGSGTEVVIPGSISVKNFQWPETYGVGVAYQLNEQTMLVADYKRIGWAAVMKDFRMVFTPDAGGFIDATMYQKWEDQNVFEIGGAYKTSDALTLRAGLNLANNPVPDEYMNPLFPAIATNHLTLGVGYTVSEASSIDFSYVYVPKVTGGTNVEVDFGGYSAQLMYSYRM